jgi:hypothetical protein
MMWSREAQKIIDILSPIQVTDRDLDSIGYYVAHLGTTEVWPRAKVLGEALMYHATTMTMLTKNRREDEQLCLPFSL